MARRWWTAAVALIVFLVGLWLALVPYQQKISIGELPLSGECPSALVAAFTSVPENAFYDLGSGDGLPAELCARSARPRLTLGAAFCLAAAAIAVAMRKRWRGQTNDR